MTIVNEKKTQYVSKTKYRKEKNTV